MLILLLTIFMVLISYLFIQLNHPLSIGFILLIQTFLSCLVIGASFYTFWYSYILFLVFLGGMLVLFIYMTTLASNEMFNFSMKPMILMVCIFISLFLMISLTDKTIFINYINFEMINFNSMNYYNLENKMILNKLYNYPSNLITILLINYLFFTLIVVVNVTNFFKGPLRMMM